MASESRPARVRSHGARGERSRRGRGRRRSMPLTGRGRRPGRQGEAKTLAVGEATPPPTSARPIRLLPGAAIPLLRGGPSKPRTASLGQVMIPNQALATGCSPARNPIGNVCVDRRRVAVHAFSGDWRTVVGVVGNTQRCGTGCRASTGDVMPSRRSWRWGGLGHTGRQQRRRPWPRRDPYVRESRPRFIGR